ncbi:hypothetical protein ESCO_000035 [Escovopsis weberi]|uniref:Uncharacterized protein n=1 Tax=Escovopsis weberi TaxID=150374 RepID=A0A0N0RT98_ESCWE|nr:hypothetical protein ESCO_000035 [Escovopsis weberi]
MNGQEREHLGKVFEKGRPPQEQMSYYHWKILLDLAWYSASTQLAGFFFLHHYFADRPVQRTFRILSVGVFVALLIAASLPRMDSQLREWDPVLVFWENILTPRGLGGFLFERNRPDHWVSFEMTLLSTSLLAWHFIIRSVELSCGAPNGPTARLRRFVSRLASRILSSLWQERGGCLADWWNQAFVRPLIAVFLVVRLYCDLYQSAAVKVLVTVLITLRGSISLYETRFNNALSPAEDDIWAFGQISAVMASAIPIFAAILSTELRVDGRRLAACERGLKQLAATA